MNVHGLVLTPIATRQLLNTPTVRAAPKSGGLGAGTKSGPLVDSRNKAPLGGLRDEDLHDSQWCCSVYI